MEKDKRKSRFSQQLRKYLITGILTAIPIWITWLVIKFLLDILSRTGGEFIVALSRALRPISPSVADWILNPWFLNIAAVIIIFLLLWFLGWAATLVVGRRMIGWFDNIMERIPFIKTIYGGVKKLLMAFQKKPDKTQRVVLINYPSPEMKTVGLVTRTLTDRSTGLELAAVYVPTTPNPTSGYLEIVPVKDIISTDWTIDEAMTFIVSGGAVGPDQIDYLKNFDEKGMA